MKTTTMGRLARALACTLVAAAALAVAPRAEACADGAGAQGDRVSIVQWKRASWNPDTARGMAVALRRLEAIRPPDATIVIENGTVECEGAGCRGGSRLEVGDSGDLALAFDAAARLVAAPAAASAKARTLGAEVYTVQVFVGSERGARAARERVHALSGPLRIGLTGFYEEGDVSSLHGASGLAIHPIAHLVRDGSQRNAPLQVVVGAHRTQQEAARAADKLRAAGIEAFPRVMPPGATVDEPVFTEEG